MEKNIAVSVTLDTKTFRRFALFDTFVIKKHGRKPILFSLILLAFAVAALWLRKEQSGMIAAVLLVIGLGLPILYIGVFISQVNLQAERFKLGKGRKVYVITLENSGVTVHNLQQKEEDLRLSWDGVWRAYQRKGCVYLYASPAKAFLLPAGQADAPDREVLGALREKLPSSRLFLS